jgi:YD repeat-containing protein
VSGHVMTYTYDPGFGVPTSVTSATGAALTLSYDTFGRLLKITGPLADPTFGWVSYAYGAMGDASAQSVRTYDGTGSWTDDYFDARRRVHTRQRRGPAGLVITSRRVFDARGQIGQESLPSLSGEPVSWTTYSYDVLGRRTIVRYPDQTTVALAYGPNGVVTVTDERGNGTQIGKDGWGRVRRVIEPTAAQSDFTYDAGDNLLTASDPSGGPPTLMTYDRVGRRLTLTDPSVGSWTFAYDTRGNLVDRTDGNGVTVHFAYDAYNRVTSKTYPGGAGAVAWTYDDPGVPYSKGRLTRIQDGNTATSFRYDAAGRVTQIDRLLDGTTYTLALTYDAANRVVTRAFPDGEMVTYVVNEAGWISSVTGSWPGANRVYVSSASYNARGQRTSVRYGNGVTTTATYDPATSRLTGMLTVGPSGALQNLAYTYDAAGNLVRIEDGVGSASRRYSYDAGNRLVAASGWFGGVAEQYAYSATGNLTSLASLIYTYSDPSHPWRLGMIADGRAYTYDGNGNATSAGALQLTWDFDHRVHAMSGPGGAVTLDYDSVGHRVRKTTDLDVTRSPFPGYEIDARGVVTKWLRDVARRTTSLFTYHDDHLGSTHVISDGQGMPVQITEYSPWGVVVRSEGIADSRTRFATRAVTGSGSKPYDATVGRFLGADAAVPDPRDPGSRNRYVYRRNNPATLVEMLRPGSNEWP